MKIVKTTDIGSHWMVVLESGEFTKYHRYDAEGGGRPWEDRTKGYNRATMMVRKQWTEGGGPDGGLREMHNTKEDAERVAAWCVNYRDWRLYGITAEFIPTDETHTTAMWPWTSEEVAFQMHALKHAD